MDEVVFRRPEWFWLATLLLVPVLVRAVTLRRRYAGVGASATLLPELRASRVRRLPIALAALGFAAIVAALADPVVPVREQSVVSRGLDIAIVLDLSSSMEEVMGGEESGRDRVTRLDVTKRAISEFVDRRPQDRIGLVVFSDNAYVVSPLTHDHDYVRRYVASIDERTLRSEGMTAIGEGVATADMLLRRQATDQQRSGVLIVFTDGEHNHGRDPVEAVAEAYDSGHRMHLIGVDLDDEVKQKPAVRRLVSAVEGRGGRYFTADTHGELARASAEIDQLETGTLIGTRSEREAPAYEPFASAAILFVTASLLLGALPFFIDLT